MSEQLLLEGGKELADERIMSVPREGVVTEQQQTVVPVTTTDAALMAANEIGDVVGDHGSMLRGGMIQQEAVVDPPQVTQVGVLHG